MFKECFLMLMLGVTVFQLGCTSNEIRDDKEIRPDAIFFDYNVWGDEESGNITVKLQYRFGGLNGTSLALEAPAKVELDGELLTVDSSKMNGAWYEINKPISNFEGRHLIKYTDTNNKQYEEEFDFKIFSMGTLIPKEVKRGDLVFELEGLAQEDYIRVLATDTSFYSRGIDRLDTVFNGKVLISRQDLENLKNGPISLEFYRDDVTQLKQATEEGGRLLVSMD